ncbi:MAG: hypothetical protein II525_04100, partial [Bacteroidales bacterium]|nr:hypothetical protein [Bacteroidales bacterium]
EIEIMAIDSLPPLAAGMVNVTRGHAGYRLSPAGLRFARPVSVELGYDSLLLPKGHSTREIRTFLYNSEKKHWEALPRDSVMEGSQNIVSQSKQAGEMINAIVQLPELPESKAFTPTMLTELEAAHPATGITMMEPPAANSQGTANLSYPITVPAGRNGLQPNLSVSYSSEAGNGLLGMGWDMQLPAITVDSKWGVPRYDSLRETECYSYNGQELLPSPHYLAQWENRNLNANSTKVFRPRTEGSFEKIERHGNSPKRYFWVVTDKGGTKYYYGTYDGSTVATSVLLKDGSGNIGHWPLCRVEDLDGNFMTYHYTVREQEDADGNKLGKQLWPDSIVYTGHRNGGTEEKGKYKVLFGGKFNPMYRNWRAVILNQGAPAEYGYGIDSVYHTFGNLCDIKIRVRKRDKKTGGLLSGAVFGLDDGHDELSLTTNGSGEVIWKLETPGLCDFSLKEVVPPAGWCTRMDGIFFHVYREANGTCHLEVNTDDVQVDSIINENALGTEVRIVVNNGICPTPDDELYTCGMVCDCDSVWTDMEGEYPYDLRTDARLGFLRSSKEKLRRIVVMYKDSVVRSYSFCYGKDIFGRAQLRSIRQYGADCGEEPYTHTFSYYEETDMVRLRTDSLAVANAGRNQDQMQLLPLTGRAGRLVSPMEPDVLPAQSVLDATRQFCFGGGVGGYVGLGCSVTDHETSLTLDFDYSHSSGSGRATLADVTGDGLPDRVFVQSGQVYYRRQLPAGGFDTKYDSLRKFSAFLRDRGDQYSLTAGANAGVHGGLGGNYGTHRTTTYLADVNGDGLPDVVSSGGARAAVRVQSPFNMEFDGCGLPRITKPEGYYPQIRMLDIPSFTVEEDIPLVTYDLVRAWRCQIPGQYQIFAPATYTTDSVSGSLWHPEDSVTVSVEYYGVYNNEQCHLLLADTTIGVGCSVWVGNLADSNNRFLTDEGKGLLKLDGGENGVFNLEKDGMLFFRARTAHGKPTQHLLRWSPQVLKSDTTRDPNGRLFPDADSAGRCQLLRGNGLFICPFSGTIRYEDNINLAGLNDVATCEVWHNRTLKVSKSASDTVLRIVNVSAGDTLKFLFRCGSNVDLAAHPWFPQIYYTDVYYDTAVTATTHFAVTEPESFMYRPLPYYDQWEGYYARLKKAGYDGNMVIFLANGTFASDSVTFVVKNKNKPTFHHLFTSASDTLRMPVSNDDYLECYLPQGKNYSNYQNQSPLYVLKSNYQTNHSNAALPLHFKFQKESQLLYGRFYGGWSQFQYRHDGLARMDMTKVGRLATSAANTATLSQNIDRLRDEYKSKVGDTTALRNIMETDNLLSGSLLADQIFDCMPLTANGETRRHEGMYPNSWIKGDTISLGCLPTAMPLTGEDGMDTAFSPDENSASGGGMRSGSETSFNSKATDKVSHTLGASASASTGLLKIGANGGFSRTKTVRDFMDLNGDGVPDFIDKDEVCYSLPCRSEGAVRWAADRKRVFGDNCSSRSYNFSTGLGYTAQKEKMLEISRNSNKGNHAIVGDGSVSGHASTAWDLTVLAMIDMNGDGLPDKVDSKGNVWLNTGYGFTGSRVWQGLDRIGVHSSTTGSVDGALNELHRNASTWKSSYSGGVSVTVSENSQKWTLADMNGDGLPDLVQRQLNGRITYHLNTGSGFDPAEQVWATGEFSNLLWGSTSTIGASLKATFGGCAFGCKVGGTPSVNGSVSHTNSRLQISDFDGDGIPDLLKSTGSGSLKVCYAHLGRTGLLKTVTTPLGGSITMDYDLTPANVYHSRRWVMTKVMTHDSLPGDGCDSLRLRIRYDHGYYDRTEREFLGFAVVVSEPLDGSGNALRTNIQYYDNRSVHAKGSPLCEALVRIQGTDTAKYVVTTYSYTMDSVGERMGGIKAVFPKLTRRQTCYYEGENVPYVTAWETYVYENTYGNVTQRRQGSDNPQTGAAILPAVTANISYHTQYNNNRCVNKVASVEIKDADMTIYRKRTTEVDNKGHYTAFRDWYDNTHYLNTTLQYDSYGNVTTMRGPNTTVHYTYDNFVHTYPTSITDTFGVTSELKDYDFRFGIPRTIVDQAGSRMEYTLDEWGRTKTIKGPKEIAAGKPFTIRYTYAGKDAACRVSTAMTENYDPEHPQNPIKTYTYCDGLGRIVQTRKEAEVNGVEKLVVSGHTVADALGRTVASYYPTEIHKDSTRFRFIVDGITPSTATYDVMDRPLVQTAPDASTTTFQYGFEDNYLNKMLFATTTTDANNHSSIELKDVEGKPWAVQAAGRQFVYFNYNPVGDNTKVYSAVANDWERNYTYDLLGRRLTYQEGELVESLTYNGGNLAAHSQSWLENGNTQTKTTTYHYNAHRLDSVSYEDALTTIYHYDQYGRVDSLYDESGVMCYEYGNMGEVTRETRIYALPFLTNALALSTQFTYDSWGRIQNITYPDNEVVSYAYDLGGQLQSITNNSSYTYLDNVSYDRFGAKVSQTYGNGLVTNY